MLRRVPLSSETQQRQSRAFSQLIHHTLGLCVGTRVSFLFIRTIRAKKARQGVLLVDRHIHTTHTPTCRFPLCLCCVLKSLNSFANANLNGLMLFRISALPKRHSHVFQTEKGRMGIWGLNLSLVETKQCFGIIACFFLFVMKRTMSNNRRALLEEYLQISQTTASAVPAVR